MKKPTPEEQVIRMKARALAIMQESDAEGVEGMNFGEITAYLRLEKFFDSVRSVIGLNTAQMVHVIRVCQGDISDQFQDLALFAVEGLGVDGFVRIDDQANIFLTASGRRADLSETSDE